MTGSSDAWSLVDASVPSPARMWDYYLGGKDNLAVDRAMAEQVIAVLPTAPLVARLTRQFLVRVVHDLAAGQGIRQFLDIGSGLPTGNNTHEVAQQVAPSSRIVYVDDDPVVVAHSRALMISAPEGSCDYLRADVREVDAIISGAARTLDFTQPVAVLMLQLLHFVSDEDDPYGIVRRVMDAVPSGSFLALVHGSSDVNPVAELKLTQLAEASGAGLRLRSREEVARFFDGLELTGPGLVSGTQWLDGSPQPGLTYGYCAVARKP